MKRFLKGLAVFVLTACIVAGAWYFKQTHSAKARLRQEGIRYYRMADYENAADCFTLALQQKELGKDQMDCDIYYYLAEGEMKQEQYAAALTYYQKLLAMGEKSPALYTNLGICYQKMEHNTLAVKQFKQAIRLQPKEGLGYYNLCQSLNRLGWEKQCRRYAKKGYPLAVAKLQKRVRNRKTNQVALNAIEQTSLQQCALLAYYSGDYKNAYEDYACLQYNGQKIAQVYMGHALAEQGEYDRALQLLEEYEQKNGKSVLASAKIVYCYIKKEAYEKALQQLQQMVTQAPEPLLKELLYEQGILYEYMGKFDQAYDCFVDYITRYPGDKQAKREYEFLKSRVGY